MRDFDDGDLSKAAYRGGCPACQNLSGESDTPWNKHSNVVRLRQPDAIDDPLTEVLPGGAR